MYALGRRTCEGNGPASRCVTRTQKKHNCLILRSRANCYRKGRNVESVLGSTKLAVAKRGKVCVPTICNFKKCAYRFHTRITDEFRTTIAHHKKLALMENVDRRDTNRKALGLQWCYSANQMKCKLLDCLTKVEINILNCVLRKLRGLCVGRI